MTLLLSREVLVRYGVVHASHVHVRMRLASRRAGRKSLRWHVPHSSGWWEWHATWGRASCVWRREREWHVGWSSSHVGWWEGWHAVGWHTRTAWHWRHAVWRERRHVRGHVGRYARSAGFQSCNTCSLTTAPSSLHERWWHSRHACISSASFRTVLKN